MQKLHILGCRGIPARYGGFETFAERLALQMTECGWDVSVYCQDPSRKKAAETTWQGIRLIHVPSFSSGALGSILFDLKTCMHARRSEGLVLTLGYNTALFSILYSRRPLRHVINMDGIEWRRRKWGIIARTWLRMNEQWAAKHADHLIADHPEIETYLSGFTQKQRITMIPYGADRIQNTSKATLKELALEPGQFGLIIARAEPENSIEEMIRGFCKTDGPQKLVVVSDIEGAASTYAQAIKKAADDRVIFAGAIYDQERIRSLREHAAFYAHGHTVGGTNPSLVESLGAGRPVIAHDNPFNRQVAGEGALYFSNEAEFAENLTTLLHDSDTSDYCAVKALERHSESYEWTRVLEQYKIMLEDQVARLGSRQS